MRRVLDTNAVSALMRGDAAALERLRLLKKSDVSIPQPVLAEIAYGVDRLPRSKRREALRRRFDLIRGELPRAPCDVAIAAHALAAGAVLVTANLSHRKRVPGLDVEDWGEPA